MTRWAACAIGWSGALTLGSLERIIASQLNPLRAELGVPPFKKINEFYLVADLVLAFTAEPFEYPRSDWSQQGPARRPRALGTARRGHRMAREMHRPLVLVTCSTLFQNDRKIAQIACEAFDGEPLDVVITTVEIDPASFIAPANVRIERFVPHSPVLDQAACVVCHAGMGITQKALAHGVPVVAVPFGRDQPEVARRVEVARAGVRLPARKLTPAGCEPRFAKRSKLRPGAERIAAAFAAAGGPTAAADALEQLTGGGFTGTPLQHREPAA